MEGVEEAAVEQIVDSEPAAEAAQMEVDAEEEAPAEEKTEPPEEKIPSPEPRKPTPATDVDVEMTATPRATPSHDGECI